jgi:hypothetical protein
LGWMPCFAIWDGVAGVARFVRSWIPKFLVVSHCCLSTSETVQILNATLYTRIKRKIWIAAPHSLFLWHYFSNKKKQHSFIFMYVDKAHISELSFSCAQTLAQPVVFYCCSSCWVQE